MAADLAHRQVAVIAASATPSAVAAKGATSTIPIIFAVGGDTVKFGLVKSVARPDGNATGINFFTTAVGQKRLGLLHELVAKGAVIGFLVNPSNPNTTRSTEEAQAAADQLGHKLIIVKASTVAEIDTAFAALVQANVGGLVVDADAFFVARRVQITTLATRHGIPAIYAASELVVVGGLMSYASSIPEAYRSMGNYTARVLKGTKVADLPVLQPTKLELAINLSTARACVRSHNSTGRAGDCRRCDRIADIFAAAHMSAFGTKRTWPDVRLMSAFGGKADIGLRRWQSAMAPCRRP